MKYRFVDPEFVENSRLDLIAHWQKTAERKMKIVYKQVTHSEATKLANTLQAYLETDEKELLDKFDIKTYTSVTHCTKADSGKEQGHVVRVSFVKYISGKKWVCSHNISASQLKHYFDQVCSSLPSLICESNEMLNNAE